MINETFVIAGSAASIGFVHTILGPDHYLPLVAMAKTNGWSGPKTASYVAICGISHVLGTIVVGLLVFLLVHHMMIKIVPAMQFHKLILEHCYQSHLKYKELC